MGCIDFQITNGLAPPELPRIATSTCSHSSSIRQKHTNKNHNLKRSEARSHLKHNAFLTLQQRCQIAQRRRRFHRTTNISCFYPIFTNSYKGVVIFQDDSERIYDFCSNATSLKKVESFIEIGACPVHNNWTERQEAIFESPYASVFSITFNCLPGIIFRRKSIGLEISHTSEMSCFMGQFQFPTPNRFFRS